MSKAGKLVKSITPSKASLSSDRINHWIIKSEGDILSKTAFTIDQLYNCDNSTSCWDGVRNHVAKNQMLLMKKDDKLLYYHSSCKQPGIVGIVNVVKEAYPDHTQFDSKSDYYDSKSTKEKPIWWMVYFMKLFINNTIIG